MTLARHRRFGQPQGRRAPAPHDTVTGAWPRDDRGRSDKSRHGYAKRLVGIIWLGDLTAQGDEKVPAGAQGPGAGGRPEERRKPAKRSSGRRLQAAQAVYSS
jgi:hypothetical protein